MTSNLIILAQEGFRYLKRLPNGLFVGMKGRRGSTHKLKCTRPRPRYLTKDVPPGVIRICYDDPRVFLDFPKDTDGQHAAVVKLAGWNHLSASASPTSAVAVPFGRKYQTFCAGRAEAAANGSLYNKENPHHTMAKKTPPKAPKKNAAPKAAKDTNNGVTRPKEGSETRKVWDFADKLKTRADVLAACAKAKINPATATTQFGKWRKYNGLEGRSAKPVAPKKAAKKKAPKAPAKKAPKAPAPTPAPVEAAAAS
jgi:hypothetical protein